MRRMNAIREWWQRLVRCAASAHHGLRLGHGAHALRNPALLALVGSVKRTQCHRWSARSAGGYAPWRNGAAMAKAKQAPRRGSLDSKGERTTGST